MVSKPMECFLYPRRLRCGLAAALLLALAQGASAATCTWDGGGANELASNRTNWSGDAAPTIGDLVVLNTTGHKNMTWDLNLPVGSWSQSGYTGTVTVATVYPGQGAFTNLTVLGDCIISNGSWTHNANPDNVNYEVYRLKAIIGGNLSIGANGTISAAGRGYREGWGPGYGVGGAHGGIGINGYSTTPGGGRTYGSITAPTNLGSGGNDYAGGPGGGLIWLTVSGAIQHEGLIDADARHEGYSRGAGGSVFLTAGSLAGNGTIRARGGTATGHGPGGGGRISLVVTNAHEDFSHFNGQVGAFGGNNASAGTIYMETADDPKDKGELIINNNGVVSIVNKDGLSSWYLLTTDMNGIDAATYEFSRITLTNCGVFAIGPDDTLIATNAIFYGVQTNNNEGIEVNGGTLLVRPDFALSNFFIRVGSTGSTFSPSSSFTIYSNAEYRLEKPHSMTCDVTVAAGGKMTHTANPNSHAEFFKMKLSLAGNMYVAPEGVVDVTGRGFPPNYGPGMNTFDSGASHGGQGVRGNSCYGSIVSPTTMGSGGWYGGAGGGLVQLSISGMLRNEGAIRANAAPASQRTGSGGSVYITAGAIAGAGAIEANSAPNVTGSYPGGGGRISLTVTNEYADFSGYSGSITAYGGRKSPSSQTSGGAGTIYLRESGQGPYEGALFVKNDDMLGIGTEISASVTDTAVGDVFIQGGACLMLNTNQALIVNGDWHNSASFTGLTDSAVIFAGAAGSTSSISGYTTFSGFICTNGLDKTFLFKAGTMTTIGAGGRLLLAGNPASTNLVLRSMTDGAAWYLTMDPLAAQAVSSVDVKDSDALAGGGAEVIAVNSKDRGGNPNWKFMSIYPGQEIWWTGASNTAWSLRGNWDLDRAPIVTDVIVIPGGCERYPELDADNVVHVIDMRRGATLALNGWNLTVTNTLAVAGKLAAAGTETVTLLKDADFTGGSFDAVRSTLRLAGGAPQSLNLAGATFFKILVENSSAPLTFYGGFTATELLCEAPAGTRALIFEPGKTVSLRDILLLGDESEANIALRSALPGEKWKLSISGYE